ncbi:MAG: zinc ABC transporter solute-binding protein, partial [bacterium]|nr:zinc ABC transporter solute-binding protein [bacterium]
PIWFRVPPWEEPGAEEIAAIQKADLILLQGAGYAKWVDTVSLPLSRTVDTTAGFRERYIEIEDAVTHSHGPEGEHSHGGLAYTTWLDPELAESQAEAVAEALARVVNREELTGPLETVRSELRVLDSALAAARGSILLASHPVYQYLARRYDLEVESMHWEPGEMPDDDEWRKFDNLRKTHRASVMLWEGPPGEEIDAALSQRGIRPVVFHTCDNRLASG